MPPYASKTDLDAFVGYTVDTSRATLLLDLASNGCDTAAASVGATIAQQDGDTRTLDGNGHPELLLPGWPVTAVDQVVEIDTDGTETTLRGPDDDSPEYRWSRTGELIRVGTTWPDRPRSVRATWTHGYADADVPITIKNVVLAVAGRMLINPQGLQNLTTDGTTPGFGGGVGPQREGRTLLDRQEQAAVIGSIR